MRVMEEFIENHDLDHELEAVMIEETGNISFYLGSDSGEGGMDETSDCEDPEAEAKQKVIALLEESQDKKALLEAVSGALECRALATDLERARMQLEDVRSQHLRMTRYHD
jgi:hypothetical protein